MTQWLFIVRPARPAMLTDGPTEREADLVGQHFGYWRELVQRGVALVVGRTQTSGPETLGIAIFRAEDQAAAKLVADNDPAVIHEVFKAEVLPYHVALLGDPAPFRY